MGFLGRLSGVCALVGWVCCSSLNAEPKFSVWSEFVSYKAVDRNLEDLKNNDLALNLAVSHQSLESPDFFSLLKRANDLNIDVRLWPLLHSINNGYWINKWNVDLLEEFLNQLIAELSRREIRFTWLVLDLEVPYDHFVISQAFAKSLDLIGLMNFVKNYGPSISWTSAKEKFKALVDNLHNRGFRIQATALPFILDEINLGRHSLQHLLGTPLMGIPWDRVSFMVYRPIYQCLFSLADEDLVYSYAKSLSKQFGSKASIDLGPIGAVGMQDHACSYKNTSEVQKDIAAALAGGVSQINLFSLDGMLQEGGIQSWTKTPEPERPIPNLTTGLIRWITQSFDLLLQNPEN